MIIIVHSYNWILKSIEIKGEGKSPNNKFQWWFSDFDSLDECIKVAINLNNNTKIKLWIQKNGVETEGVFKQDELV